MEDTLNILGTSAGNDSDHGTKVPFLKIIPVKKAPLLEEEEEEGNYEEGSESSYVPSDEESDSDYVPSEEGDDEDDEAEEEPMDVQAETEEACERLSYAIQELQVLNSIFNKIGDNNPIFEQFNRAFPKPLPISHINEKCSDEMLSAIFSYLPRETLGTVSSVCKKWKAAIYTVPQSKRPRNNDKITTRVITWRGPSISLKKDVDETERTIERIRREFPTYSSWVEFVTSKIKVFRNLTKVIVDITLFKFLERVWPMTDEMRMSTKKRKVSPFIVMMGELMDSLSNYKNKIKSFGFIDNPKIILPDASASSANFKDIASALSSLVKFKDGSLSALDLSGISTYRKAALSYDIYSRISNISGIIKTLKSVAFPGLVTLGSREHYALIKFEHVYAESIFIPFALRRKFLNCGNEAIYKHQSWRHTQKEGLIKKKSSNKRQRKSNKESLKFVPAPHRRSLLSITAREVLCGCSLKEEHFEEDVGRDVNPLKRDYFHDDPHCEGRCLAALMTDIDLKLRSLTFSLPESTEFVKDEVFSFFEVHHGKTTSYLPLEVPGNCRDVKASMVEYPSGPHNVVRVVRKTPDKMKQRPVTKRKGKKEVDFYNLLSIRNTKEHKHSDSKKRKRGREEEEEEKQKDPIEPNYLFTRLTKCTTKKSFGDIVNAGALDTMCTTRPYNNPISCFLNLCKPKILE